MCALLTVIYIDKTDGSHARMEFTRRIDAEAFYAARAGEGHRTSLYVDGRPEKHSR